MDITVYRSDKDEYVDLSVERRKICLLYTSYQFFKVFDEHQLEYILLAKGASDDVYMVGKLAACLLYTSSRAVPEKIIPASSGQLVT